MRLVLPLSSRRRPRLRRLRRIWQFADRSRQRGHEAKHTRLSMELSPTLQKLHEMEREALAEERKYHCRWAE